MSLPNSPSSGEARDQGYDEDDEEDEKQDLRDPGRCHCDAAEAEDRGYHGYSQEHQSPIEHRSTPLLPIAATGGGFPSFRCMAALNRRVAVRRLKCGAEWQVSYFS